MNGIWMLIDATCMSSVVATLWLQVRRNRRVRLAGQVLGRACEDAPLAQWCRHMSLTVVTHTGTVFSTSLAELAVSDAPEFRSWNVPIQVCLWSDLDDYAASVVPAATKEEQL